MKRACEPLFNVKRPVPNRMNCAALGLLGGMLAATLGCTGVAWNGQLGSGGQTGSGPSWYRFGHWYRFGLGHRFGLRYRFWLRYRFGLWLGRALGDRVGVRDRWPGGRSLRHPGLASGRRAGGDAHGWRGSAGRSGRTPSVTC